MKKLALGLSVATLAVAILAGLLWNNLRAERVQLADLRERVTEMEAAQVVAAATPANAPAVAGVVSPDPSAAGPATTAAATTAPTPQERLQNGVAKGVADVLASPEGRDLMKDQLRAVFAQQFPDLAEELRMTPAEAEKFMDLLIKQGSESAGDVLGMMGGTSSADAQRKIVEKQLASEKEIARTLGNKYPAWQEYQGTAAARQQVSQLRALLGTGPDALSESQSKPLIAALGAEQTRMNKAEQDRMGTAVKSSQSINVIQDQLNSMTANNERLTSAASSYLNTNQLNSYKRMLAQQENMLRTVMGSMGGQGGAPR